MPANIFHAIPEPLSAEMIDVMVRTPHIRIERIVSQGQASPEG